MGGRSGTYYCSCYNPGAFEFRLPYPKESREPPPCRKTKSIPPSATHQTVLASSAMTSGWNGVGKRTSERNAPGGYAAQVHSCLNSSLHC
jgi:hypothetical protein